MKAIIPFIVIGVCLGMYFIYVSPQSAEVKSLVVLKNQYVNVLAKSKEINDKRIILDNQYNSIPGADLERLGKVIPDTFDPISFINNINGVAVRDGIIIKDFRTSNGSNSTQTAERGLPVSGGQAVPYATNSVTLSFSGRYSVFQKFLLDLESDLNLVDIVGLSMTPESSGKGVEDSFSYSLNLQTYSLK